MITPGMYVTSVGFASVEGLVILPGRQARGRTVLATEGTLDGAQRTPVASSNRTAGSCATVQGSCRCLTDRRSRTPSCDRVRLGY